MSEPLEALIVVNTYPPWDISGVGELARELHAALPGHGINTSVLTRGKRCRGETKVSRIRVPKFLFPPLAPFLFLRTLLGKRFDVVHLNESDGFAVGILVRFLRALGLTGARIVATLQVSYVRERRAVRRLEVDGRVVGRPSFSELVFKWIRCPLHIVCGRITAVLADAIVVPSACTAGEVASDYGVAPSKIVVIHNGIDTEPVPGQQDGPAPALAAVPRGAAAVVFAGRFRIRKGVQFAVEAFEAARRRHEGMVLILAGSGEQRRALEKLVASKEMESAVVFAGKLGREDVGRLLAASDIFVMPSLYEGFPVAVLEAMSCGLPVCAADVSGIPEAVRHGETGFLHPVGGVSELAEHLARLAGDARLRREMGDRGRALARDAFSRRRVAGLYTEVYKSLLRTGTSCNRDE